MIKFLKRFRFYELLLFILSGFLGISLLRGYSSEFNLKKIEAQVEQRYPKINHISVTTLEQWLNSSNPPILLDVREPEEYAISHLKGAYLVPPNTPMDQVIALLKNYPSQKVVVYC